MIKEAGINMDSDRGGMLTSPMSSENTEPNAGVERAFRHLDAAVAKLDENVGRLEHRLSPISVDRAIPTDSPDKRASVDLSPVGGSIDNTADTIDRLSDRVNEAIYRLDI